MLGSAAIVVVLVWGATLLLARLFKARIRSALAKGFKPAPIAAPELKPAPAHDLAIEGELT